MNLMVENNTSVIICSKNHLPNGMFLNLNSHHIQQEIFRNQIDASIPLKKQLWQQTIVEKIKNQGILLQKATLKSNSFEFLASKVLRVIMLYSWLRSTLKHFFEMFCKERLRSSQ
jgi:CRISPR-associated protein Cas1